MFAIGIVIGTLGLVGLVKAVRRGRGGRGRWMLRRLSRRLGTTPEQDKVITSALDDVRRAALRTRGSMLGARDEWAKAMRGETFDAGAVEASTGAQQASVDELRKAVHEGLRSVHATLTPDQRGKLADLLERGPGRCRRTAHSHANA